MKVDTVQAHSISGNSTSSSADANTVVSRDANSDIHADKFHSEHLSLTHTTAERTTDTVFYSSDGTTVYKNTAAGFRESVGLKNVNNIAATTPATPDRIVLRDSDGDIFAVGVESDKVVISGSSGELFRYTDGTRTVYGGCDSNSPWFGTSSAHNLRLVTNSSDRITLDTSGNVGIGTASPGEDLHVYSSNGNAGIRIESTGTLDTELNLKSSLVDWWMWNNGSDTKLRFYGATDGWGSYNNYTSDQMVIDTNGNVGIGTTSPDYKLDVNGDINVSGVFRINDTALANSATIEANSTNLASKIVVRDLYGNFSAGTITATLNGDADTVDGIHASSFLRSDADDWTSGKLGIGTASPLTKLHIPAHDAHPVITFADANNPRYAVGFGARFINGIGQGIDFFAGDSNNNSTALNSSHRRMSITAHGDVGIGTASPNEKLEIYGNGIRIHDPSASPKLDFVRGGTNRWPNTQSFGLSNYSDWRITANGMDLSFQNRWTGGNSGNLLTAMTLTHSNGNVGIGTTSPSCPLQVSSSHSIGYTVVGSNDRFRIQTETPSNFRYGLQMGIDSGGTGNSCLQTYSQNSSGNYAVDYNLLLQPFGRNVGIGTNTPYTKLHVHGSAGAMPSDWKNYFRFDVFLSGQQWGGHTPISIFGQSAIITNGYFISHNGAIGSSDERIKKNIVDADDAECLETLRLLKPKKYQYRDVIERGEEPVWGFIAQEVRGVLPHATILRQDVLPNIYELANVSSSNVITFTNFNTSDLESNATTLIRTKGIDGEDHDIHLAEVIDAHTIRVEEDLTEWIGSVDESGNVVSGNQLFVHGQEVDDFVYLKKESIFTVATAALQEVDRQQQVDKARIAELETQLASVLSRLTALENPSS